MSQRPMIALRWVQKLNENHFLFDPPEFVLVVNDHTEAKSKLAPLTWQVTSVVYI